MKIFDKVFEIPKNTNYGISGLTSELNLIYIYNSYLNSNKNILVVVSSLYEATSIYQGLSNYTDKVLFFPMDDFITSEAIAISPELKIERINTINKIMMNDKYIVITNLMGILRYLPKKETWKNSILKLKVNDEIKRDDLVNKLYNLGYDPDTIVSKNLSMAIRGYVIDIFPLGYDNPIRLEFWGDMIDSIKTFNIDTQLSMDNLNEVDIYPASEFIVPTHNEDVIRSQKYLPCYDDVSNIYEYLANPLCFYFDYSRIKINYMNLKEEILEYKENTILEMNTNFMFDLEDINIKDEIFIMNIDNYEHDIKIKKINKYISEDIINYQDNIEALELDLKKYLNDNKKVILCIHNKKTAEKIVHYIDNNIILLTNEEKISDGKINIINKNITKGFIYDNYVVICEYDIFKNNNDIKVYKNNLKLGTKIKDIDNIVKGDYIVHEIHGIGKYDGIATINQNGMIKDYLKIIYYGNDLLYVPASKFDKITKFTSKEGFIPKLDRLGTDSFTKKKISLRKKIEDIAAQLLKVSAEREIQKGFAFKEDDEDQISFEKEFEFKETTDQISATYKIKSEMEKMVPMDMLLCGDVGYGKTEVAFRAIFKAVNSGKQVAYLCPTTILSNQQYVNAMKRFSNFPINIALMNRFVSLKEQKRIVKNISDGKVDILFGTHRILSEDIKYKDLGLLIIDEEQRFGVKHKEKIKEYKSNVDVLTLSATPIPRTLQMSLSGVRSLALIETPPVDRYPIQTYVLPENINVIKDAIYKELSRKGQIFILYNKVLSIEKKVFDIKKLVPEARIDYAHGQMSKTLLENKMQSFINYEVDILVCTTIIETGIDIPNANTLIIIDADKFGLSQLYQIRGRIGRSNRIGYAYLMYDNKKELNDIAVKRLQTIKEFTELGSGFKIAKRDLSIRGAGDILGSEQSGFIDTVGIDMYLKMLKEAIDKLNGIEIEEEKDSEEPKPLVNVSTYIGNEYTNDDSLKIEIHQMINDIDSLDSLNQIRKEFEDRFGKVSHEIELYMQEEWFEKMALKLDIINVNETRNYTEIVISESMSKKLDGEKIFYDAYEISRYFRFKYEHNRIMIIIDTIKLDKHYLFYVNKLLDKILKDLS